MKSRIIITKFVILLIGTLLVVIPASANPNQIIVDSWEVYCTFEQYDTWWEGNVLHERGSVQTGFRIPISIEDPIAAADYTTIVNSNVNHNSFKGTAFGTFVSKPEDYSGTMEGTWSAKLFRLAPAVWPVSEGHAVGHGTGDLEGWKVMTEFSSLLDYSEFPPENWPLVFEKCGYPPYDFLGISRVRNIYEIH